MTSRHIAVDARMLHDSGVGTYLQHLLPRIAQRRPDWKMTLIGDVAALEAIGICSNANVRLRQSSAPIFSVREQIELPLRLPRSADLVWCPMHNVPLAYGRRLFVTIHDLCHLALPEATGGMLKRVYARLLFASVARRATGVVCDSEFTRGEFHRLLPSARVVPTVVHLGVGEEWSLAPPPSDHRGRPYVLYVGNVKRHKNVGLLVRAFARIAPEIPHELRIVGRTEGLTLDRAVLAEAERAGDRVVVAGELSPAELRQQVRGATVLVNPSLYEGFGLTPLEAMAAGCPVIVARAGSLPEVCGDAALYCSPYDQTELASQLLRVIREPDLRTQLVQRGRARAAQFTWERCAKETVAAIDAVLP